MIGVVVRETTAISSGRYTPSIELLGRTHNLLHGVSVRLNEVLTSGQNPGSPVGAVQTWLGEGEEPGITYHHKLGQVTAAMLTFRGHPGVNRR